MPVIARDAVASDHLVYAWPFPIGPEDHEVACAEDELVVMCPAWLVHDRLGPGRHRWRTPDPSRPVAAYFVLTAPVEVSFDMLTQFVIPTTGQPVRLRAAGSLQVRCVDPALLVAQFVGLPFDSINEGVLRSVSRSIERMLARLLTRRVVMAGTPQAVTDPSMLANIVEELVAYNPAAGAVFGVELVRFGHLSIMADDGSRPWHEMVPAPNGAPQRPSQPPVQPPAHPEISNLLETVRAPAPAKRNPSAPTAPPPIPQQPMKRALTPETSGATVGGEIGAKPLNKSTVQGHAVAGHPTPQMMGAVPAPGSDIANGTPNPHRVLQTPVPAAAPPRRAGAVEVQTEESTQPGLEMKASHIASVVGGEIDPNKKKRAQSQPSTEKDTKPEPAQEPRGAVLGIGMGQIGVSSSPSSSSSSGSMASGEIGQKIPPGGRVLVPGPDGLMQSATVRQLLQGYYELEVGGSGETIWVPMNGVVPE
jgi:hypothetical protein